MTVPHEDFLETQDGFEDSILAHWVEELTARLEANEPVDLSAFVQDHPERAEQLCRLLPAITMLAGLGRSESNQNPKDPKYDSTAESCLNSKDLGNTPRILGDFQIVREVGRGGMGVVYEARQLSLGRRVALKMLPFAAAMDAKHLARFRTEAQVAGLLHHSNIVPVYAVGCEDDIHYYAMQFISGQSAAELVRNLRAESWTSSTDSTGRGTTEFASTSAAKPLLGSTRTRAHARAVARFGLQAAEALAVAHGEGVIHRDIKPANLLIDDHGHLWVTDFGLARLRSDSGLTLTGDVIGTLRYMSPEQALGRRSMVDHRTDLYGLGVTLYELLCLQPAFHGDDHRILIRRILEEEPLALRRLNPSVPHDLETIVHKAMAREPNERYITANAMAEDLRRFLEGRPILASRPTMFNHTVKWVRRRWRMFTVAATLVLIVGLLGVMGLTWSNARLRSYIEQLKSEKDRADWNATEALRLQALAEDRQSVSDRHLYAAQIRLVRQALDQGQCERAQDLLADIKSTHGKKSSNRFVWQYLNAMARREILQYPSQRSGVNRMILTEDGQTLIHGTRSGEIHVLDVNSGETLQVLTGHTFSIEALAASEDGRVLVSASADWPTSARSEVFVWDLQAGKKLVQLQELNHCTVRKVWLSADTRQCTVLAVPAGEVVGQHYYFDLAGPLGVRKSKYEFVYGSVSMPGSDGKICMLSSTGNLVKLNPLSGEETVLSRKIDESIRWAEISHDGLKYLLITDGPDAEAIVIDLKTGDEESRLKVGEIQFGRIIRTENDGTIVFVESSNTVLVWNRRSGANHRINVDGMDRENVHVNVGISRDGRLIALSTNGDPGGQSPIQVIEVATGKIVATYPGRQHPIEDPVFSPDGGSIFIETRNSIKRWILKPTPLVHLAGHLDEAWALAFSPDSNVLLSGSDDTDEPFTLKVWDLATGRKIGQGRPHTAMVSGIAISSDRRRVATSALFTENNLKLWKVGQSLAFDCWEPVRELKGHTDRIRSVVFSPDGTLLASAGADCVVRLWDAETGKNLGILSGHSQAVRELSFSSDGKWIASASNDMTVRIWDVAERLCVRTISGPAPFTSVAFSPQEALLAAATQQGVIVFIDPITGEQDRCIYSEDSEARSLRFSPDGETIAAAGMGKVIRIWDVLTCQELLDLEGHTAQINAIAFSPDGRILASCDHSGEIKIWSVGSRASSIIHHEIPREASSRINRRMNSHESHSEKINLIP